MEYLDIYDEEGNLLGSEERSIVHEKALWHNTVHCWLYDNDGNVYFQIRSDKNKLYTTASGHVLAGETINEAFGREIKEEIGFSVNYNNAKLVEIVKFILDRDETDGSVFRDRAFSNVYICDFHGNMLDFDFDSSELNGVVRINAKETLNILKNEKGSIKGIKCLKDNNELKTIETIINFEDFLVNKGETAYKKYGKVLETIIEKTNNGVD